MNAVNENRQSALIKTQAYLSNNAAAFSSMPQIAAQKLVLDSQIDGIILNDGIATSDTTGYAIAKGNARVAMTNATLRMTRATKALAIDLGDVVLEKKVDYTKTELGDKRDSDLHVACKQVSEVVTPLMVQLAGYLILPAHLVVLDTTIATYFSTLPQPGGQTDLKVIANRNVDELLSAAFTMLSTKMDAYVDLYIEDFPDLVEGYYLSRAIDDMTGGGGGGTGGGGGGAAQIFNGNVGPMMTASAEPIVYNAAQTVKLSALSLGTLIFQLMQDMTPMGAPIVVASGMNYVSTMGAIAPNGNRFNVTNNGMMTVTYNINIQ